VKKSSAEDFEPTEKFPPFKLLSTQLVFQEALQRLQGRGSLKDAKKYRMVKAMTEAYMVRTIIVQIHCPIPTPLLAGQIS
jgi:hypothetical protein